MDNLTIEELESKLAEIEARRDELKTQARAIVRVLDAKRAAAAAAAKLAAMSDVERAALAQLVQAQGIASGESFGG